ncbi:P-loop containing nucleoside triphosphate hydrolase protein [Xylaria cf. heliscus]|nr:P-loop containing nucleoside triphosphate hydrolase protein [Xylaria cf. heliscus]
MYRKLHLPPDETRRTGETTDSDLPSAAELLQSPSIPQGDIINIFPTTIVSFNIILKKWDRIQEVQGNKKAFNNLVIDKGTKLLLKALISNQIKTESGPGTDKTFTAVVLLDEADVFLEERSFKDLNRNAWYQSQVFLPVLEYYDGSLLANAALLLALSLLWSMIRRKIWQARLRFLILPFDRVGSFDETFKSRIQLALHYDNLMEPQRRKIWRNFFNEHLGDLPGYEMNRRQIRNAITMAR